MWFFDGLSYQNKRTANMDRLMISMRNVEDHQVLFAVICDGVGSTADGEKAASVTVQMLMDWFEGVETVNRIALELMNRILMINQTIAHSMNSTEVKAATTVSAVLLLDDDYYMIHVGDSRVFSLEGNGLKQITTDQANNGKLTQYLGQAEPLLPQYEEGRFTGEVMLLCTDGVFKRISPDELVDVLRKVRPKTIRKTLEKVIDQAVERGESDNITLAIVMKER